MSKILDTLSVVKTGKFWKELVIMTLGMFVTAAAVYYFLVPSKLIIGTISGLSIVLNNIFEAAGIHMILGPLTDVWDAILPWQKIANDNLVTGTPSVMGDPWLDLCCFVLLLSAAQALMFSINASTGGLDILAKIVNKYLHFDIGASVSIAGAVICCTAFFINPFRMVVIGLIGTWINGLVVDYFTASLNNRKRVCIVSKDYDRIRRYIIDELHRGCTLYEVIGGYSNERSIELEVLLTKDEFSKLMAFLKDNEVPAFTTAGNVSEVYGLWTKHSKKKAIKSQAENR